MFVRLTSSVKQLESKLETDDGRVIVSNFVQLANAIDSIVFSFDVSEKMIFVSSGHEKNASDLIDSTEADISTF